MQEPSAEQASGQAKPRRRQRRLVLSIQNSLSCIAAWQFAGFFVLLLLVWANEIIDIPAFFFGEEANAPDYLRASLASGAILVAAIIVVGTTYLKQRSILSEVLTICSYCHKIAIDQELWETIEEHLHSNPMLRLTHGICPDCIEKVRQTWIEEEELAKQTGDSPTPASPSKPTTGA